MQTAPCKFEGCGATWHTKSFHTVKERKPMVSTKPMNRVGKVQKKTNAATAKWKKTQPSNHQGYWACHYCLKWTKEPVVEHMESKTRRQDLRTVDTNFTIACSDCNGKKLSKSHDEFCTQCN